MGLRSRSRAPTSTASLARCGTFNVPALEDAGQASKPLARCVAGSLRSNRRTAPRRSLVLFFVAGAAFVVACGASVSTVCRRRRPLPGGAWRNSIGRAMSMRRFDAAAGRSGRCYPLQARRRDPASMRARHEIDKLSPTAGVAVADTALLHAIPRADERLPSSAHDDRRAQRQRTRRRALCEPIATPPKSPLARRPVATPRAGARRSIEARCAPEGVRASAVPNASRRCIGVEH